MLQSVYNLPELMIKNNFLPLKDIVWFLHLTLDSKLTWLAHLNDLKTWLCLGTGFLKMSHLQFVGCSQNMSAPVLQCLGVVKA